MDLTVRGQGSGAADEALMPRLSGSIAVSTSVNDQRIVHFRCDGWQHEWTYADLRIADSAKAVMHDLTVVMLFNADTLMNAIGFAC